MAQKVALLIGVGVYEHGFPSLLSVNRDTQAVRNALLKGGFSETDIRVLADPDDREMRDEIETFFADRQKDDLLLLYFSGHGVTDNDGCFYLTSYRTRKERLKATAIPANFIHNVMESSKSKHQIVVLDCCFSGAFAKGMQAKSATINLKEQFQGQGRAVLTSSSSYEYSFEQKDSDLSVYTRYLVEGIETGAADSDGDGWISVEELYNYTRDRVREAVPVMKPEIYTTREGYGIRFAKAPTSDPQLNYRREVDRLVRQKAITFVRPNFLDHARKLLRLPPRADVSISDLGRRTLEVRRNNLNLSVETATIIEFDVLKPYRESEKKRHDYEQMLIKEIRRENPLSEHTRDNLKHFQQALGLRDQDVAPIEARILEKAVKRLPKLGVISHQNRQLLFLLGGVPIAFLVTGLATYSLYSARINQRPSPSISQKLDSNSSNPKLSLPDNTEPKTETIEQKMLDEARSKMQTKDFESAIEKYKELTTLNPKSIEGYVELGDAYRELSQTDAYRSSIAFQKIYQHAVESYDQAIQLKSRNGLKSSDYILFHKRGIANYYLPNYQKAIEDYDQAIRLQPNESALWIDRGNAYFSLKNYQEAIKSHDQAIEIKEDSEEAYKNRGEAYAKLGNSQKAFQDFWKAVEYDPEYADAYASLGSLRHKKGDIKGAIDDYEKASQIYYNQKNTAGYDETQKIIAKLKRQIE